MAERLFIPVGPTISAPTPLLMIGQAGPKAKVERPTAIKHGDLLGQVTFTLRHVRDMNNVLGFLTEKEHEEMLFAINEDTFGQICKFHNISRKEAATRIQLTSGCRSCLPTCRGCELCNAVSPFRIEVV